MAQANRDGNQVTTLLGSYNGTPVKMKIEHATGALKAVITNQALAAPGVDTNLAEHDGNSVHSALGSFNGTTKPLLVTNSGGYLRAINN